MSNIIIWMSGYLNAGFSVTVDFFFFLILRLLSLVGQREMICVIGALDLLRYFRIVF